MRRPGRAGAAALGTWLCVAAAACDRTPRLIPAGADSSAALPADSTAVYVQMARERWESPEHGDEAARLTTRILIEDLRAHPGQPPGERARDFIDSLAMGAEVVGRDLAVVNLFSRSDPSGGSWPLLIWREGGAVRYQPLEAGGLRLVGVSPEPSAEQEPRRVAVLFHRTGPLGPQPFVFVWQRAPGAARWSLAQSLGADSLGHVGSGRFLESGPGGVALETRTYSVPRGFDECASCPHVVRLRRLRWDGPGLVLASQEVERGTYPVFVQFVLALAAGERAEAERLVTDASLVDQALDLGWDRAQGAWRLAPGYAANAAELLFFRGGRDAYRVQFAARGAEWRISGFQTATRSVE